MTCSGKILAFVEIPGDELDETGRGLLSYASRLAVFTGRPWSAAAAVLPDGVVLHGFSAFGAPSITHVTCAGELLDTPELLGRVLAQLVTAETAQILLLPHNDLGSTLAPLVAASLDAALLTEVTTARQSDGLLYLSRAALGGRITETRTWDGSRPLVITVPVRSLSQVILPTMRPSQPLLSSWQPAVPEGIAAAAVTTRIPPDPQTVDLVDAEVIFSAGKGCSEAVFGQLKELCQLLNVSFGVTRPVYDLGWTGFERMVGQTGRTVTPRLYLALGISGSMHHVGGIKDSRRLISVNNDSKAPIFPNSDEGFVSDLGEVIPRLLDRAKATLGGAQ